MLQVAFIVMSVAYFVLGQMQRLYFFPRAEDARRRHLLSDSFGGLLSHEQTVHYYNNDQTSPFRRLVASSMESAFFTRAIVQEMLILKRATTLGYLALYLVAVTYRPTELGLLGVAAQVLFSEELIARWLRMEWLRMRTEQAFDNLNRLLAANRPFTRPAAQSEAIELFGYYETTKSTAATLLSSTLFHKRNERLSAEWAVIRSRLGI